MNKACQEKNFEEIEKLLNTVDITIVEKCLKIAARERDQEIFYLFLNAMFLEITPMQEMPIICSCLHVPWNFFLHKHALEFIKKMK